MYKNFGVDSFDPRPTANPSMKSGGYTELVENRLLEMRAGLFFHYPRGIDDSSVLFFLPFWENPTIKESNVANFAEYNVINRNGSLFTHTGTKSRKIGIDFYLTLPHIFQSFNTFSKPYYELAKFSSTVYSDKEKAKFRAATRHSILGKKDGYGSFEDKDTAAPDQEAYNLWKKAWTSVHSGSQTLTETRQDTADTYLNDDDFILTGFNTNSTDPFMQTLNRDIVSRQKVSLDKARQKAEIMALSTNDKFMKTIQSVNYLLDTLRTCISNNATTTSQGPPMIRVRHGAMYRDTPCICKSYKISVDDKMGMDLKTLMPYRIKVTLDLMEVRTGDFGTFSPGEYTKRDNLVGWEAVVGGKGVDPGSLGYGNNKGPKGGSGGF